MPFNNYAPQYIFKGQVQSDTAPSANNDLVRKQDVSGLSFISSIASGSSSYLSVSGGELSVSSLLISDVHVDGTQTSLANFISNEGSTAASLKKGDILVLTNATGGAETYIVSGADGSAANNYTQIESGLTSAEIVAKLSAGAGINISAGGQISSTITQYTDTNARAALSGGAGITYNSSTGQITSSITQYTDANARAALSVGAGLTYNSSTGQFACSITQYADADARAAVGVESNSGIAYNSSTGNFRVSLDASGGLAFNGASIQIAADGIKDTMIDFGTGTGQVSTADLPEQTNLYFTDARARAALSAGTGLTYNSSTGQFVCSITQYTDANARAAISAPSGSGLQYNSSNGQINVDNGFFRATFTNQSFDANTAKTFNHDLGEKLVHVSVYDSNDDLVHAEVSLTDSDNLTIKCSDALTGVSVVISI